MEEFPDQQIALKATQDNYERFMAFITSQLLRGETPASDRTPILIACEELIVNVMQFAYGGDDGILSVAVEHTPHGVSITLVDNGIPFNLVERVDADVSVPLHERQSGGLGIFIVKNLMDEVKYEYRDNRNIVRITKRVSGSPRALSPEGS